MEQQQDDVRSLCNGASDYTGRQLEILLSVARRGLLSSVRLCEEDVWGLLCQLLAAVYAPGVSVSSRTVERNERRVVDIAYHSVSQSSVLVSLLERLSERLSKRGVLFRLNECNKLYDRLPLLANEIRYVWGEIAAPQALDGLDIVYAYATRTVLQGLLRFWQERTDCPPPPLEICVRALERIANATRMHGVLVRSILRPSIRALYGHIYPHTETNDVGGCGLAEY